MATTNLGLSTVVDSNTIKQFADYFNSDMAKIDCLPIPMEYGKNNTMHYLKFTNGKVFMWGRVDYGTSYPCATMWAASAGYASDAITLDFPIALASNTPVVIPHVIADKNPDMWALTQSVSYTQWKGNFLCAINDSASVNSKVLNIFVIGDWK